MNERSFIVKSFDKTGSNFGFLPRGHRVLRGISPARLKPPAACRLKVRCSNRMLLGSAATYLRFRTHVSTASPARALVVEQTARSLGLRSNPEAHKPPFP